MTSPTRCRVLSLALSASLLLASSALASEDVTLVEADVNNVAGDETIPEQESAVRLGFGQDPAGPSGSSGSGGAFKNYGSVNLGARISNDAADGSINLFAPLRETANGLWFIDARFVINDVDEDTTSLGVGYRHRLQAGGVFGATAYYDRISSAFGNNFDQLGIGLELLTSRVDARINGYFPESPKVFDSVVTPFYGDVSAAGHSIFQEIGTTSMVRREGALEGFSGEVGFRVTPEDSAWAVRVFGGYYDFDTDVGHDYDGFKGRVELRAGRFLTFDALYYDDEELLGGGNWAGAFRVSIPLGGGWRDAWQPEDLDDRLGEYVHRSPLTRAHGGSEFEEGPTTDLTVTEILNNVYHVDSDAGSSENDGTVEDKYDSLEDAIEAANASGMDATVLVDGGSHSGGTYEFNDHSMAIFSTAVGIPVFGGRTYGYDPTADNAWHEGGFQASGIGFFSLGGFDLTSEGGTGIDATNVGCVTSLGNSFYGFDTGISAWFDDPSLDPACLEVHDNWFEGGYTGLDVHHETGGVLNANVTGNFFDEQHDTAMNMYIVGSELALSLLSNDFFGDTDGGYMTAKTSDYGGYYYYGGYTTGVEIEAVSGSSVMAEVSDNVFADNYEAFDLDVGDDDEGHDTATLSDHVFGSSSATVAFSGNTWSDNADGIDVDVLNNSALTMTVMGDTFSSDGYYGSYFGNGDSIYVLADTMSTVDLTVSGSTFTDQDDAIEARAFDESTLNLSVTGNSFTDSTDHDIYVRVGDNSTLNATVDGNTSIGAHDEFFEIDNLYDHSTANVAITNNNVSDVHYSALYAQVNDNSHLTMTVMGNNFVNVGTYGFYLDYVDDYSTANIDIIDNNFLDIGQTGIEVYSVYNESTLTMNVIDNAFTGTSEYGIYFEYIYEDATVTLNVENTAFDGQNGAGIYADYVYTDSSLTVNVMDSSFTGDAYYGIGTDYVYDASHFTVNVDNSTFQGQSYGGVYLNAFYDNTTVNVDVTNSSFAGDGYAGVYTDYVDDNSTLTMNVIDNHFIGNDGDMYYGVYVDSTSDNSSSDITITGNTFSDLYYYGIWLYDTHTNSTLTATVNDNLFAGYGDAGLVVDNVRIGSTANITMNGNAFSDLDYGAWVRGVNESTVNWTADDNLFTNIYYHGLEFRAPGDSSTTTLDVTNSVFTGIGGDALNLGGLNQGSTLDVMMTGNLVSGATNGVYLGAVWSNLDEPGLSDHTGLDAVLTLLVDDNSFTNVETGVNLDGVQHGGDVTAWITNNTFTSTAHGIIANVDDGGSLNIDASNNRFLGGGSEGDSDASLANAEDPESRAIFFYSDSGNLTANASFNEIIGFDVGIDIGSFGGNFAGNVNWNELRGGGTGIAFCLEPGEGDLSTYTAGGNSLVDFGTAFYGHAEGTHFSSEVDGELENNDVSFSQDVADLGGDDNTGALRINGEDYEPNDPPK